MWTAVTTNQVRNSTPVSQSVSHCPDSKDLGIVVINTFCTFVDVCLNQDSKVSPLPRSGIGSALPKGMRCRNGPCKGRSQCIRVMVDRGIINRLKKTKVTATAPLLPPATGSIRSLQEASRRPRWRSIALHEPTVEGLASVAVDGTAPPCPGGQTAASKTRHLMSEERPLAGHTASASRLSPSPDLIPETHQPERDTVPAVGVLLPKRRHQARVPS